MDSNKKKAKSKFFNYAKERYKIFLKKQQQLPKPWTNDPVLQKFRFCNIFREDDKTTVWFRENIREPLRNDKKVLFATVAFRWFNRIETAELIKDLLLEPPSTWDIFERECTERIKNLAPVVTGSYIIKTPNGHPKWLGVLKNIENFWFAEPKEYKTLEKFHRDILTYPYMGSFSAYEVTTDLRHTYILENAEDIMSWAAAGPGAARGLARVYGYDLNHYSHYSLTDQEQMNLKMQEILKNSKHNFNWPKEWPSWEMREVEHTLCEYDKYVRCGEGGKTKMKYDGGASNE